MTKLMICVLMLGGLAAAGDKKGTPDNSAKCKEGCAKRYESCMKANKTESKTQAKACADSRYTCNAACNK